MPTKTRTKKPAAKPQRKPRKDTTNPATAEDIGRSIGDALGRRLESLLAKPDNPGFDAVSAWTVEKLGDGVTGYRANHADQAMPAKRSLIEEALSRLRDEINAAVIHTDMSTDRLESVLSPQTPANATAGSCGVGPVTGELSSLINSFADRVAFDNRRRSELLDRLEL